MITIKELLHWYALGKKGHTHSKQNKGKKKYLRENKNVTAVQDFLSDNWNKKKEPTY